MSITKLLQSTPFLAAELSAVSTARAKCAGLETIRIKTAADAFSRGGNRSHLHREVDRLEGELIDNPTLEAAEAFHAAHIRCMDAEHTTERISDACNLAASAASKALLPVVEAFLQRAETSLDADARKTREALASVDSGLISTESNALESRIAGLKSDIAQQLGFARKDPLQWLDSRDLATAPEPTKGKATIKGRDTDNVVGAILDSFE